MRSATKIWWETPGKSNIRIQTSDADVHHCLMKSRLFALVGKGVNTKMWIYRAEFSSKKQALQEIKTTAQNNCAAYPIFCSAIKAIETQS